MTDALLSLLVSSIRKHKPYMQGEAEAIADTIVKDMKEQGWTILPPGEDRMPVVELKRPQK